MTGEELNRKYWELCGWTIERESHDSVYKGWYYCLAPGVTKSSQKALWCSDLKWLLSRHLEPLHLDANLALAEASKIFPLWKVEQWDGFVQFDAMGYGPTKYYSGQSVCEVILKALIAAKEQR